MNPFQHWLSLIGEFLSSESTPRNASPSLRRRCRIERLSPRIALNADPIAWTLPIDLLSQPPSDTEARRYVDDSSAADPTSTDSGGDSGTTDQCLGCLTPSGDVSDTVDTNNGSVTDDVNADDWSDDPSSDPSSDPPVIIDDSPPTPVNIETDSPETFGPNDSPPEIRYSFMSNGPASQPSTNHPAPSSTAIPAPTADAPAPPIAPAQDIATLAMFVRNAAGADNAPTSPPGIAAAVGQTLVAEQGNGLPSAPPVVIGSNNLTPPTELTPSVLSPALDYIAASSSLDAMEKDDGDPSELDDSTTAPAPAEDESLTSTVTDQRRDADDESFVDRKTAVLPAESKSDDEIKQAAAETADHSTVPDGQAVIKTPVSPVSSSFIVAADELMDRGRGGYTHWFASVDRTSPVRDAS